MPEDSSAEHYQKKKQRKMTKKAVKKYRNLSEEGKEKNDNSVVND